MVRDVLTEPPPLPLKRFSMCLFWSVLYVFEVPRSDSENQDAPMPDCAVRCLN